MLYRAAGKQQVFFTMGEYDFVVVDEVPNDEVMMKFLSSIGKQGNVRTKTLKAWAGADAAKIVSQLQ